MKITLQDATNSNDLTLDSYDAKTREYEEGTPPRSAGVTAWLDESLGHIPNGGKVLELGSAFGRDAEYIQGKGFQITCSDAVPNFVKLLKDKGFDARLLNALKNDMGSGYDMVFANAVLLHFTHEQTAKVLDKVHAALNNNGIFAFSVKRGDGDKWTEEKLGAPRYFYYWQPEPLKKLVAKHGFEWLSMSEGHSAHNNADWLRIIARKNLSSH